MLIDKQLRRGVHRSPRELETAIGRYIWTKTADEILASVARFCHRIFGFTKVCYRGAARNRHRLEVAAALANLFMMRKRLLRLHEA